MFWVLKRNLNEIYFILILKQNICCRYSKYQDKITFKYTFFSGCLFYVKKEQKQFMQIIDITLRVEINEGHNNAKTDIMSVMWNFSSRFQI